MLSEDDRLCVTLGGDHSIALATLLAHLKADPDAAVVWVDAHADLNTPETSATGHMHGMPVGLSLGELRAGPGHRAAMEAVPGVIEPL